MNYVAISFLAILALPFCFLIAKLVHRRFFAVPPLSRGIRLIPMDGKWGFRDGMYTSRITFRTHRGAALHAIGYRQKLSRL